MRNSQLMRRLNMLSRLLRAEGGNVATLFALALVPVVGLVGAGIDFGRANAARTDMQSALDATALMLSKEVADLTPSQLQTKAGDYFKALFTTKGASDLVITPTYTTDGGFQLVVTGSATMPNEFMGVLGHKTTKIGAMSQVRWGNKRLRVALVLDNTGSMADSGKIDALKNATKNLLKQLKDAATNSADVYVSIIPFSKDVNVGPANYNASWLNFSAWEDDHGSCSKKSYKTQSGCISHGHVWNADNHNTWNGCVTDRGHPVAPNPQDWDQKIDPPVAGNPDTYYIPEQYSDCPLQMMGLSNDWTAMNNLVDAMYPAGSTNQPIGLVWGWNSLAGTVPFTVPTKDPKYDYDDVIILMSDGLNTMDRWYGNGVAVSQPVNHRMIAPNDGSGTCANIKQARITIYTIQVNTGNDPTSTLLQQCATDSSKFYLVTSANQMLQIFKKIGDALSQLRLSK